MRKLSAPLILCLLLIKGHSSATAPKEADNDIEVVSSTTLPPTPDNVTLLPVVVAVTTMKPSTTPLYTLPVINMTLPTLPPRNIPLETSPLPLIIKSSIVANSNITSAPKLTPNATYSAPSDLIVPLINTPINNTDLEVNSTIILHDTLGTKFLSFTRKNPQNPITLLAGDSKAISGLIHYDPSAPTRFIVHSSFDGPDSGQWMKDMKNRFLQIEKANIFIVDWSKSAAVSLSDQRLANIRMVGNQVAKIIEDLIELRSTKPGDVHLITHSFGSFAADVVGRKVKKLGRISGLDPGGPNFDAMPADMRLDKSDAIFVDVIHTDSSNTSSLMSLYGRGTTLPVGHMDFYPNGGGEQPGCSYQRFEDLVTRPIGEGIRRFVACNHYKAIDYYMDSITPADNLCTLLAYPCDNYTDFMEGKCHKCGLEDYCPQMGFRSYMQHKPDAEVTKNLYLTTSRRKPYCIYHYSLEVKVSDKPELIRGGVLLLRITGEYGMMEARINGGLGGFKSGNTTSLVTSHHMDIGAVKSLSLAWLPAPSLNLFSDPTVHIDQVTIAPMSLADKQSRLSMTRTLCPIDKPAAVLPFYRETFFATDLC